MTATSTAPPASHIRKTPKLEAYYDAQKKTFWARNARGEFMDLTEGSLKRMLKSLGFRAEPVEGALLSQVENALLELQMQHDVHYAGGLAGYDVGLYSVCGNRVLVTRGPALIKPLKGDWPVLGKFLGQLLGDVQKLSFFGWMKAAWRSLRAGPPWRPGQMLALCGPAGCGKSLLQSLITEMLGGRSAKPYRYMTGQTAFNSELFEHEHLMIEDEAASTDLRTRRMFGSQLKNLIVNETQSHHRKGRDALHLTPFWRLTVSLNAETENLMVLPPMDDSIRDKVLLLLCGDTDLPFEADDMDARRGFRQRLSQELAAFLAWLSAWPMPEKLKDRRYGVKAYHHPTLLAELESLAPESRLLSMIETLVLNADFNPVWEGTATELEKLLKEKDKTGDVVRLLSFQTACGVYLSRLAQKYRDRFVKIPTKHSTIWKITL